MDEFAELQAYIVTNDSISQKKQYMLRSIADPNYPVAFLDRFESDCLQLQDGHNTPVFQEKFVFSLIEGFREISVAVWNSNTKDDFIGSGKVQLGKVLSKGYDDRTWYLYTNSGG
ncbi:uncharacterized protein LOC126689696 [Quercus robur]|uniref:uncharacterized protein LOC126689696 n=1 Tax=Quercus robur TaxID=38942 RepID=UPI0021624D53|nr:uncharacterized protein LOC126689696 [Quercus robur]